MENLTLVEIAAQTTIVGMSVVFVALFFLYVYIETFRRIFSDEPRSAKKSAPKTVTSVTKPTSPEHDAAVPAEPETESSDDEMIAVAAAVAVALVKSQHAAAAAAAAANSGPSAWRSAGRLAALARRSSRPLRTN